MPDRKLSFWRYFPLAYQDAFRMIQRMWPAVLTVVAASAILGFIGDKATDLVGTRLGQGVLTVLVSAVMVWATAPYLIALYRSAATDEVTARPETLRNTMANRRFTAWFVLLGFIAGVPYVLYMVVIPNLPPEQITPDKINGGAALALLVASVAFLIFSVRATTLMPSLALDPEHASLSGALAQSKGQFWFIAGVEFIALMPLTLGGTLVADIVNVAAPILILPVAAAISGLTQVVQIAVTTRLYQRYAAG